MGHVAHPVSLLNKKVLTSSNPTSSNVLLASSELDSLDDIVPVACAVWTREIEPVYPAYTQSKSRVTSQR